MDKRGLILLVLLLLVIPMQVFASSAIGISPPSKRYFMFPGEMASDNFRILYSQPFKSIANVYATGDLKEYVIFKDSQVELESGASIEYKIVLPEDMGGKTYIHGDIRAELLPPVDAYKQGGTTGAFAAIGMVVDVSLPRPGKYLNLEFEPVESVNTGEIVYFTLNLKNYGTEELTNLVGKIKIYDAQGNLVTVVTTGSTDLRFGEEKQLYSYWETGDILPSFYTAEAEIEFGGDGPANAKTSFLVGDLIVKITDVVVNTSQREVVKFNVDLQSLWNSKIRNVYADIEVFNSSNYKVGDIKSTSEDIGPRSKTTLLAYLDSGHLLEGPYNAHLKVYYDSKTAEKIVPFNLEGDKTRETPKVAPFAKNLFNGTNILLLILILLLANLFIFLILSRRNQKNSRKFKNKMNNVVPVYDTELNSESGDVGYNYGTIQTHSPEHNNTVEEVLSKLDEISKR